MRRLLPLVLAWTACSSADDGQGPRSAFSADQAAAARAACQFKAGTVAGLSLAKSAPLGTEIPINNVVILMMENRSFDHLFGDLPAAGVTDVDVAPADASNPDSQGNPVPRHHLSELCFSDTNHEWSGSHLEYDDGKNDGFVKANENFQSGPADGTRAMGYYTAADLPFMYWLAQTWSISDRSFAAILDETFPNREYLYAATSFGHTDGALIQDEHVTIMESLQTAKLTWADYYSTLPALGIFLGNLSKYFDHTAMDTKFFTNAAAGTLEQVVFLDPDLKNEIGSGDDFHPPGDVQNAQAFVKKVVDAVTASPQWPHLALFIMFDEHGGLYDHVPPPAACPPDDIAPMLTATDPPGKFDHTGFRVPLIVVSPYAKAHHVSHVVSDHTSVLRFLEARFHMPALTARDANADPLFDMFDFTKPQLLTPPKSPDAPIDAAQQAACASMYP